MMQVRPFEMQPAVLVNGSPKDAARFLVSVLCHEQGNPVPVAYVLNWMQLMHVRGPDFAPHAATCDDWLHEHSSDYRPDRLVGG
jgi:hypothetical protein